MWTGFMWLMTVSDGMLLLNTVINFEVRKNWELLENK
jgi:hypothetical protein